MSVIRASGEAVRPVCRISEECWHELNVQPIDVDLCESGIEIHYCYFATQETVRPSRHNSYSRKRDVKTSLRTLSRGREHQVIERKGAIQRYKRTEYGKYADKVEVIEVIGQVDEPHVGETYCKYDSKYSV